ncbi:hypothetical protein AEP_00419 [Curvibacter sp. AEP1-3]|nr:hypothetical protein AEP_00419 [Curvibacter sp. AEP1-3]
MNGEYMWWFVFICAVCLFGVRSYLRLNKLQGGSFHSDASARTSAKAPRKASGASLDESKRYTVRGGKSIEVDAVFEAWVSDDLDKMIAVMDMPTHPIDRHHLLNGIVSGAYKRRGEDYYAQLCADTAETYLLEMPKLLRAFRKDGPRLPLPHVPVFEKYATLLAEQKQFDRAIEVCELAIAQKLHDNTKSGYEGRIKRIERLKAKEKT